MNSKELAVNVFHKMYDNDAFSQWLQIEPVEVDAGKCILRMKIRKEMLNGFNIAHGGIAYSLADSALAFASNSHGKKSVSIETSISHVKSVDVEDTITANAVEISLSDKVGIYMVTVKNQHNITVAIFKGTVYRTNKDWFAKD